MIYTLTANPAIDYNISCDGLAANTVTRTRNAVYTPNGKGLNVSFTLDHYGVDTTILGFFAGFSGEYIVKGAEALGVPVKPVWTDGITRVNVFLNAGPDTEYNMVNAGAAINEANEQEMFELIDSLDDMTCLVISGSPQHLRELPGRGPAPREGEGRRVRARYLEPSAGRPHCYGAVAH
jgi:6-phosphofructokinase 2